MLYIVLRGLGRFIIRYRGRREKINHEYQWAQVKTNFNRGECEGRRVYKYMNIYLWSTPRLRFWNTDRRGYGFTSHFL